MIAIGFPNVFSQPQKTQEKSFEGAVGFQQKEVDRFLGSQEMNREVGEPWILGEPWIPPPGFLCERVTGEKSLKSQQNPKKQVMQIELTGLCITACLCY